MLLHRSWLRPLMARVTLFRSLMSANNMSGFVATERQLQLWYNGKRIHSALNYHKPVGVYFGRSVLADTKSAGRS